MPSAVTPGATATLPRPVGMRLCGLIGDIFQDGAIRYGIKFGVAGVLAIFIALVLRIQDPTWALFTVFVLMIAQYVGAIAEKSFFRIIGTVVGGLLGYVITASLEQNPWIFLPIVGLIVGFSTAMFGQSRFPYAFLLCGLTMVVVVSNGLANPDQAWQFMLWRTEEVCIGIVATLLVQCIFWPRYAREEFITNACAASGDLRDCFSVSAKIFLHGGDDAATIRAENFPSRISGLRGLLDFGARESLYFRERLPTYFAITTCLSRMSSAIVTLGQALPPNSLYRTAFQVELEQLHRSLENALDDLSHETSSPATRLAQRQAIAVDFKAFEASVEAFRHDPRIYQISPEDAMILGIHGLALDDLRQQIHELHELLDSLPENSLQRSIDIEPFVSPIPPAYWIRNGIKSGVAVMVALFLGDWFQPPGVGMFVLGTWVFTAMNAASPGGQGDRRAFHYAIYDIAILLPFCIGLLAFTPMLSSYAVMNVVIFTWLFIWGYLSFTTHGVTIPMQVAMLVAVGVLGLNGQRPVPPQAVLGVFFGIVLAQLMAALVQRTLWPSLPQWELRDRFVEYLRLCRKIVTDGPPSLPLWQRARLALIPGEALLRIEILTPPICPVGEPEILISYLQALQRVGNHLIATIGKLGPLLPPAQAERGKELIGKFESVITSHLEVQEQGMATSTLITGQSVHLASTLEAWKTWTMEMRAWMLKENYPILDSLRLLGLLGRYTLAGNDLIHASEEATRLRLNLYMGDYVL